MVGTTIEHKEHSMRTLTEYTPGAMSTQTHTTMILPSPLWNGAFFTLGRITNKYTLHTMGNAHTSMIMPALLNVA